MVRVDVAPALVIKRPRHYRFVGALPKNNYGKVLKTELRGLLAE
jgi:acyl-coenzyme A synthetase/AMP-(fatty) acid ligase